MTAACFLDRDGVILEEAHFLSDPKKLRLLEGAGRAIQRLNAAGAPVVVVSNQSGVARGYFGEDVVQAIHAELDRQLAAEFGARIDRYYYCPHHPTAGSDVADGRYTLECECRKPNPGMLLRAADEMEIDLAASYMIGDMPRDITAGARAGCKTILVDTGYGERFDAAALAAQDCRPDHRAADLAAAVELCLPDLERSNGADRK